MNIKRYQKDFSDEIRELFRRNHECWECGRNKMDALHHILGGEFEDLLNKL